MHGVGQTIRRLRLIEKRLPTREEAHNLAVEMGLIAAFYDDQLPTPVLWYVCTGYTHTHTHAHLLVCAHSFMPHVSLHIA